MFTTMEELSHLSASFRVPEYYNVPAWNFDAPQSSIVLSEETVIPPRSHLPTPSVEKLRAAKIVSLRAAFNDLCHRNLGVEAPSESFNRWLFEQLAIPTRDLVPNLAEHDPLTLPPLEPILRSPEVALTSEVLKRELQASLPASTYISWGARNSSRKGLELLRTYCQASRRKLEKMTDQNDPLWAQRNEALILLDQDERWMASPRNYSPNEVVEKIKSLRDYTKALFTSIYSPAIEHICQELIALAHTGIEEVRAFSRFLFLFRDQPFVIPFSFPRRFVPLKRKVLL